MFVTYLGLLTEFLFFRVFFFPLARHLVFRTLLLSLLLLLLLILLLSSNFPQCT